MYIEPLDDVFTSEGVWVIHTPVRAPQANANAERLVGTLFTKRLDWTLVLGRRHLETFLSGHDAVAAGRPVRANGTAVPLADGGNLLGLRCGRPLPGLQKPPAAWVSAETPTKAGASQLLRGGVAPRCGCSDRARNGRCSLWSLGPARGGLVTPPPNHRHGAPATPPGGPTGPRSGPRGSSHRWEG